MDFTLLNWVLVVTPNVTLWVDAVENYFLVNVHPVSGAEGKVSEGLPRWPWAPAGRLWAGEDGGSQGRYFCASGQEEEESFQPTLHGPEISHMNCPTYKGVWEM